MHKDMFEHRSVQTPSEHEAEQHHHSVHKGFFRELINIALIAGFIVLPIRLFAAQPFIVSGSSMFPTFKNGDYLIIDELSYRFENPQRGDVIVFHYPNNPSTYFIKRIIGLPGETVVLHGNEVTIKTEKDPDGFVLKEPYLEEKTFNDLTVTLADDEYFVMGDNRDASSDSRVWGPLEEHFIVGRALLRILPVNAFAAMPGSADTPLSSVTPSSE